MEDAASHARPAKRQCSGASILQLKLAAAAFRLCPTPTDEQIRAIAKRVALSTEQISGWFRARRALESWVDEQMRLNPGSAASDLVLAAWNRCAVASSG